MNKKLLALGGFSLIAGGLIYWYFLQKNGNGGNGGNGGIPNCGKYISQGECLANGCYWYNNSCHSSPMDACQNMYNECNAGMEGYQECDAYYNLCICHNNSWYCAQQNSDICRQAKTTTRCFIVDGKSQCLIMSGDSPKECDEGFNTFCPCPTGECGGSESFCTPDDKICIRKARNETVSFSNPENSNVMYYTLDEPFAATTITGKISWEWARPLDSNNVQLYVGYHTYGWVRAYNESIWEWDGGTGSVDIGQCTFTEKPVSAIAVVVSSGTSDVQPTTFVGKLNY